MVWNTCFSSGIGDFDVEGATCVEPFLLPSIPGSLLGVEVEAE
jgi:hypothetical protein